LPKPFSIEVWIEKVGRGEKGTEELGMNDFAKLYRTEPKIIKRAVKRNQNRFSKTFVFQPSEKEWNNLKFQTGTSSLHG
jgi:hypothetical protein